MLDETLHAIALSYLSGVGPIRARKLLAVAGSFKACFELSMSDYEDLKIPPPAIEQIASKRVLAAAEKEAHFIDKHEIIVLDCLDPNYPRRFDDMPDSPIVLYKRGNSDLSPARTVAIVGTRQPTPYGIAACEKIVDELSAYGATVLSGLAYGVDIIAHEASLRANMPTIGVLAHGLGEIYPSAHKATAQQMLELGALVTEYPSGMRSRKEYFPQRNRVIAGLSDAVIVIESGERGGSMITAKLAEDYNRALFALPGRVTDKASLGCNLLLKTQRANLIEGAKDIAFHLGWEGAKPLTGRSLKPSQSQIFETFSEIEQSVVKILQQENELDVDTLSHRSALEAGQLATTLLELEFRGVLRALPGKRYLLNY